MRLSSFLLFLLLVATTAPAQWRSLNGPPGGQVYDVAAEGSLAIAGTIRGVYRSTDAGRTWAPFGLDGTPIYSVHIAHGVYYAAGDRRISVRRQGGDWFDREIGSASNRIVSNGRAVFAFTGMTMHRSVDSGWTWTRRSSLVPYVVLVTAVTSSGSDLIVAGMSNSSALVLRSTNDGDDWTPTSLPERSWYPRSFASAGSLVVGVATGAIVWSPDRGVTWNVCESCLDGRNWTPLSQIGGADDTFVINNVDGLYRSRGNAEQWERVGPSLGPLTSIASSGARFIASSSVDGVLASDDLGLQWVPSAQGIVRSVVRAMIHHAGSLFVATEGGLYATGNYGGEWHFAGLGGDLRALATDDGALVAGGANGIHRTTDGGASWVDVSSWIARAPQDPPVSVHALHNVSGRLLAGSDAGIHMSTDRGATWAPIDTGVRWAAEPVRAFASVGSRVYAASGSQMSSASYGGVYVSDDAGSSFRRTELAHDFPSLSVLAVGDTVIVAHYWVERWMSFSRDAGVSWLPLGTRRILPQEVFALAHVPGAVLAGTSVGVYSVSPKTFIVMPYNRGFDDSTVDVRSLAVDGAGLLAGTSGAGLWQRTDLVSGLDATSDEDEVAAEVVVLDGRLSVRFSGESRDVSVRLVDVLGREVARDDAGLSPRTFAIDDLARGAYFVVVRHGRLLRTFPIVRD